jgi:hypothetical protein
LTNRDKGLFFYDVLSTLGGHFGLFCGMSMLGVAEIVILIIITLYTICRTIFCPLQTINEIDDPNEDEKIERMAGTIKVSNSI